MKAFLSKLRQFFSGVRLFLPLVPQFVWLAVQEVGKSTIDYWKNSQQVVNKLSDSYLDQAMQKMMTEYSVGVFWTCYGIASVLYLLGWLAMAWLTVEAFQLAASAIF
jgi:hypothetical protein